MRYYIMNKDTKVLFFDIPDNSTDFNIVIMGVYNQALIPRPIKSEDNIKSWLVMRLRLINRNDLANELAMDVSTLRKITELTNFISVTDTYWVQTDTITRHWSEISPYTNNLDSNIFDINYTGVKDKAGFRFVPFSYKSWGKENGTIVLYKRGYKESFVYAEYMASQLGIYLGFDVVEYQIKRTDNFLVSVSPCICSEATGMYSYQDLGGKNSTIQDLIDTDFGEAANISKKKLIDMVVLDFLIMNIDRNVTNIGVLFNTETNTLKGLAPLYDFNLSLNAGERDDDIVTELLYLGGNQRKEDKLLEQFRYALSIDRNYVTQLLTKASSYTFTGTYAYIANEVLQHQLKLAYSIL